MIRQCFLKGTTFCPTLWIQKAKTAQTLFLPALGKTKPTIKNTNAQDETSPNSVKTSARQA